jgi:hypothetical protein
MEQIISASGTQFGLIVNSDGSINVGSANVSSLVLITGSSTWVGVTPTVIPSSNLSNRKSMSLRHNGGSIVYLGASSVTSGAGYPFYNGETMDIDISDAGTIYGIVATGSVNVRTLEFN